LLEADAVAVKVFDLAVLDDGSEAAIEEDAAAATAVEVDVVVFVAFDDEVFNADVFEIVAADDGEDGGVSE